MKKISSILVLFIACSQKPAINNTYDFSKVGSIEINPIPDYSYMAGSGDMIQSSLTLNFLKNGFDVIETNFGPDVINIGPNANSLVLSCIITEYTDSEVIILPYKVFDRGTTQTTIDQQTTKSESNKNLGTSISTSTITDGGKITEGSRIDYTQARIGILIKMNDKNTGSLVWANTFWYSGLELHRTIDICIKNGLNQLKKLFP